MFCHAAIFLRWDAGELGDATGLVPVGDIDVGRAIDIAAVCRAEVCGCNVAGRERVVGPLLVVGIIAEEGYGDVVLVEDGDAALQF